VTAVEPAVPPRFRAWPLLAVSDLATLPQRLPLLDWIDALGRSRVPAVQLREKSLADRAVWSLARECRRRLPTTCVLLVNGRADLAHSAGADGVHLPAAEIAGSAVRDWLGPGFLVGRSTHGRAEVEAAASDGVDYVTFGPVFETPGKRSFGPPLGLASLGEACRVGLPVLAIGGVTIDRLSDVASRGAAGAAGIRLFQDVPALPALVAEARELFAT